MSGRLCFWLHFILKILTPLAIASTAYLYLYPVFNGCAFPTAAQNASPLNAWRDALVQHVPTLEPRLVSAAFPPAPFRLLVLADPQLEGDSSLPDPRYGLLRRLTIRIRNAVRHTSASVRARALRAAVKTFLSRDIYEIVYGIFKRIDLLGNDYYLAHIFRTLHWWARPSHVVVLGDLIGSQWVTDEEFDVRAWRFWNRVFAGGQRVGDWQADHNKSAIVSNGTREPRTETLGDHDWKDRVINIAGNHDIGYAGDVSQARIARFEKHFGSSDWDIRFHLALPNGTSSAQPSIHIIVLNDLVLDDPALDATLQSRTYNQLNSIIANHSYPVDDSASFTLLLTHVPLYKPEGVCVDPPFYSFHESYFPAQHRGEFRPGGLKEQNHLSEYVSRSGILEGVYGISADNSAPGSGLGRPGLILTGHDHEGCDTWHHIQPIDQQSDTSDAAAGISVTSAVAFTATTASSSNTVIKQRNTIRQKTRSDRNKSPPSSRSSSTTKFDDGPNFVPDNSPWQSIPWAPSLPPSVAVPATTNASSSSRLSGIREITVRSMMGQYGGNAGLLSLWFDTTSHSWQYQIQMCPLGIQHVWWAVHVLDLIAILGWTVSALLMVKDVWIAQTAVQHGDEKIGKKIQGKASAKEEFGRGKRNITPKTVSERTRTQTPGRSRSRSRSRSRKRKKAGKMAK